MGPIKINIKTSQIEENSEYGGVGCVEPQSDPQEEPAKKETESCSRYEGEECFYTEPASGRYLGFRE